MATKKASKSRPATPEVPELREGEQLLSIGELAEAGGMSPEQVRMWERRYGRPTAIRLPSGHRRYPESMIPWLRRIGEALSRGHRPHQVLRLSDEDLDKLLAVPEPEPPASHRALDKVLAALRAYDPGALRRWVRELSAESSSLELVRDHLAPLLVRIGEQWRDGLIDVGHEHLASEVLEDELRQLRQRHPITTSRPRVLLATLAGEHHGLGLQMSALVAAARGLRVNVLGTNTPLGEIQAVAGATRADVVGISVSLNSSNLETEQRLRALRDLLSPDVRLVVGGEGVRTLRQGPRGIDRLASIDAWDELLAQLVAHAGPEAA
ncbi:MAG: cobalamin B12-binding domain-containing protein [Planctomycetota bacterium]